MLSFSCPSCGQYHNMRESSLLTLYSCRRCGAKLTFEPTQGEKPPFPHAKHILVTFLTAGLWTVVYGFAYGFWLLAKPPPVWAAHAYSEDQKEMPPFRAS